MKPHGMSIRSLLLLVAATTACNPLQNYFEPIEDAQTWEKAEKSPVPPYSGQLKVMDWNIKFGGGRIDFFFDCFGDRSVMSTAEVESNLDGLISKINQADPDILFMQEVDIASKRSADIDMIRYILDRTSLNYAVYASQWRTEYIPSNGLGAMDSGNVLMSRFPMSDAKRVALTPWTDQSEMHAQYYLKRNMLRAKTEVPGFGRLTVITIHAEAYSQDGTKKKHIDAFKDELDRAAAAGEPFLAGGDLNALPPFTVKTKGFPDSVCKDEFVADDYSAETEWLTPLYDAYDHALGIEDYKADNERWFTHTVDGRGWWNRCIDHLFTNGRFVAGSGLVHQSIARGGMETMPLSDHAPVTATLDLTAWRR